MAAQQYVYVLDQLTAMASLRGDGNAAAELRRRRERQATAILACAWDGAWWRRGFDDDGRPFGTAADAHGKIWLNTQTWAVIAGVGSTEQHRAALNSVKDLLDTNVCGLKKLHPSYPSFPDAQDPYSGYSPGCGENGAIFCHANTWAVMAEALAGNAERAWHYYRQLVPHFALQKVGLERYQAEPYAYVSNIVGPENPRFGWANVSQVTGTAAWMDIAATQYLLGLRPELDGLRIAPVLPISWGGFKATRLFRGCSLKIEIHCPGRRGGQVRELVIDGNRISGNLIPATLMPSGATVRVFAKVD
jgi:cellobiose phosphorylase